MRTAILGFWLCMISTPIFALDSTAIDVECSKRKDSIERDNCCKKALQGSGRSQCMAHVRGRATYCDQMHDLGARHFCFATVTHKVNYCPRIESASLRAECFALFMSNAP
jgi:hypothetical protein